MCLTNLRGAFFFQHLTLEAQLRLCYKHPINPKSGTIFTKYLRNMLVQTPCKHTCTHHVEAHLNLHIHFWIEFEFDFHFWICQSVMFDSIYKKQRWKFIVYTAHFDSPFFFFFFFNFYFLVFFFYSFVFHRKCKYYLRIYFQCKRIDKDGMMPIKRNSNTLMFLLCVHFLWFYSQCLSFKNWKCFEVSLNFQVVHSVIVHITDCELNYFYTQFPAIAAPKISQYMHG